MQKARIKLSGTDANKLDEVCEELIGIAERIGAEKSGPIPLPTNRVKIPLESPQMVRVPPLGINGNLEFIKD